MIIRFARTITLPSGNLARNFRFNDCGYGRVMATYEYTDRRRNHQTARRFTVEFLNGKVDSIQARSANGGRVEFFKTSTILAELLEMLAEFNEVVHGVAQHPATVEETETEQDIVSEDDTDLKDTASNTSTVELLRGVVVINVLITLVTLGIVWYNL